MTVTPDIPRLRTARVSVPPQDTIRHLYNAAHAIDAAGHGTAELVNFQDGRLCLMGAIGVGTGSVRLQHGDNGIGQNRWRLRIMPEHQRDNPNDPLYADDLLMNYVGPNMPGSEFVPDQVKACVRAVAALLPTSGDDRRDPQARVWMYNDEECTGGEDAAQLLRQAAQKLEANLP